MSSSTHPLSRRPIPQRAKSLALAIAFFVIAATAIGASPAAGNTSVSRGGVWTQSEPWPLVAIHSALDRNGNVLTYGSRPDGTGRSLIHYDIWRPSASPSVGHSLRTHSTGAEIFCGLQITRPDNGNIIMMGGGPAPTTANAEITQYNPASGAITNLPADMHRDRWYGTLVSLPDGSIYIQGGAGGADRAELWTPDRGSQLLPFSTANLDWWYPRLFVLSDSRIFGIDTEGKMFFVSADRQRLTMAGTLRGEFHGNYTSSVMFEQDKILWFGGSSNASVVIDVSTGSPVVRNSGRLSSSRKWANATVLPDGRVLATGGANVDSSQVTNQPLSTYGVNYSAEIWNPATGVWTVGSQGSGARMYHSTALLLADGRVLVGGGGNPGPVTNLDAEIYSPDYLVRADGSPTTRPTITSLPKTNLDPGVVVSLGVNDPANISRVTLLKTGSTTHSFNVDQRFVELKFARWGQQVRARIPASSAVVTPGQYLLTVFDRHGVPSRSRIVKINPSGVSALTSGVNHAPAVYRLYLGYFGRAPKPSGLQYWSNQRARGRSLRSISAHFSTSTEFRNRYGALGNTGFVDLIYQNILNRPPQASGRSFWSGQLTAGMTRPEMMVNFTQSPEFNRQLGPVK